MLSFIKSCEATLPILDENVEFFNKFFDLFKFSSYNWVSIFLSYWIPLP